MYVSEPPPEDLAIRIVAPGGTRYRLAEDEPKAENTVSDIEYSSEIPGGDKEAHAVLAREPQRDWRDIVPYGDVEIYGPGVEVVWSGSLDKGPGDSGFEPGITPAFLGWQYVFEDDQAVQVGFIDADLTKYSTDLSLERRLKLRENNQILVAECTTGLTTVDAAQAAPGIVFNFAGQSAPAATYTVVGEMDYSSGGIDIGQFLYDYRQITTYAEDIGWTSNSFIAETDSAKTGTVVGKDHNRATALRQSIPEDGSIAPAGMKFIIVRDARGPSGAVVTLQDITSYQNMKVIGRHGLTLQGTWPDVGFTARQMLEYFVQTYCAPLTVGNMDDDGFVVPQAWYSEGQSRGQVVTDLTKYSLYDWFVYRKQFEFRKPGTYGRKWKAYVAPSGLNEVGTDSQRLWTSVVVRYQDVDGTTRTVGPPLSNCNVESALLEQTDPSHPAVRADRVRRATLDMSGVGSPAVAIEIGVRFLEEANLLSRSGSATLSGFVLDSKGTLWPVSRVKAGDWVSFVDAADPSYRKIVGASHSHNERKCDIDLDAPPEGMQALLERLNVAAMTATGGGT